MTMTRSFAGLGLFLLGSGSLVVGGCGNPVQAAGMYAVGITNKSNKCGLDNFAIGQMASNIPITITQQDANVTVVVGGIAGAALTLALGSATFHGTVDGATLSLQLFGTRSTTQNGCAYTINAAIETTLVGDVLQQGTITYTPATNGSPDCNDLNMCISTQDFNGTRPPA